MGFQRYILARERRCYLCNDHLAKIRANLAGVILKIYGEPPVLEETMRYVMLRRILRCYLPEAQRLYEEKEKFAEKFLLELEKDIY